jgi:serine/threonine protein kinase
MELLEGARQRAQVRGRQVDGRADLFAFGAVLYEMVTGQRAFQRDTPADTCDELIFTLS